MDLNEKQEPDLLISPSDLSRLGRVLKSWELICGALVYSAVLVGVWYRKEQVGLWPLTDAIRVGGVRFFATLIVAGLPVSLVSCWLFGVGRPT